MQLTRREFLGTSLATGAGLVAASACSGSERPPAAGNGFEPAYRKLSSTALAERIEAVHDRLRRCDLCPRNCGVDRHDGLGYCRAPRDAVVSSYQAHYGEEVPLVGDCGSGTIFFANCNLRCVFCQNWPIAHKGRGRSVSDAAIADMMLSLQRRGCHNINVVTPTHVLPNILGALPLAIEKGLRLPLVYNTGGYERQAIIKELDGIVDIYMPDFKFYGNESSATYMRARDYPEQAKAAIREMYRQVGPLRIGSDGIAYHGLMIRHLVMPNRVAGTNDIVKWIADSLSPDVYVNIMSQYRVDYKAYEHAPIARAIRPGEFLEAMDWAEQAGLKNLDSRSLGQRDIFLRRHRSG